MITVTRGCPTLSVFHQFTDLASTTMHRGFCIHMFQSQYLYQGAIAKEINFLLHPQLKMALKIDSSKMIKPLYEGNVNPPSSLKDSLPLSVFDKVTYDTRVGVLFAYRPPTPSNAELELGLRKALSVYRPFAGRLRKVDNDNLVILINGQGIQFIEASIDSSYDQTVSFEPLPYWTAFHPSTESRVEEELVGVQLTRFTCGTLLVGFVSHHLLGDGQSSSDFLISWGQATRGVEINPLPLLDRTIFKPRVPPRFHQFEHKGVEYKNKKQTKSTNSTTDHDQEIIVHKVRYTKEFLSKLKTEASSTLIDAGKRPYGTFVSLLAHVWRAITVARFINEDETLTTHAKLSVNGRMRVSPHVPNYSGNMILWAYPKMKVKDLANSPLSDVAKVIQDSVAKVNKEYFQSFIDFASYKVTGGGLVPTADASEIHSGPNVNVDSWLSFQFYDLDFGSGSPFAFMPICIPVDGSMFFLPISPEDGSVDVIVYLFKDKMDIFKQICNSMNF